MAKGVLWRSQLARLIQILLALESGRNLNASGLAKLCEVSPRTVYRDLDTLILAGVPIEFRPETQGYRIAPGRSSTSPGRNLKALPCFSNGAKCRALVRFSAEVSDEFRSRFPSKLVPTSSTFVASEESCLEIGFDGMDQAVAALLPFAESFEVLEPPELRSRLRDMCERIARRHAAMPTAGRAISDRGSVAC